MNLELELRLQAYVDGELPAREARQVEAGIANNPEAQALVAELRTTKHLLTGNEPERLLPESREFYWSKIQREILRPEQPAAEPRWGILFALRRYFAPIAGVALLALLAFGSYRFHSLMSMGDSLRDVAEVENLSENTGSFSFRSHSEHMFVVWVYDKSQIADMDLEFMDEDIVTQ